MAGAASGTFTPREPDWAAAREETVRHLQRLIQFNTVNPPGNEIVLARHLHATLTEAGIEAHLYEPAPARAVVLGRLRGSGTARPVLLLAHMDVVGVEPDRWSVDPFSGSIVDGYVYGRGAIDDKGMLAVNLETMLLLKRCVVDEGGTLTRDVIFLATADEEAGGVWGMGWMVEHQPELLREAEFAINEGGRARIVDGRLLYMAVQTAEKVSHLVRLTARGPGGHASVPREGNAILRLGRALAAIGAYREPVHLTPTTQRFFAELSRVWPEAEEARAMSSVASGEEQRVREGEQVLARIPVLDAVLRNGISPTLLAGGVRSNVIPAEVSVTLDVRTLPGESLDGVLARLTHEIGDALVELEVLERLPDAPASDFTCAMFEAIAASARELEPQLAVMPYLSTGATDSARLRRLGVQAFGILPFPLDQGDEARMHAHDERVSVEALEFGLRLIHGAVRRITA